MKDRLIGLLPHGAAVLLFLIVSSIYFSPVFDGYQVRQHDIETYMGMSKELRDFNALSETGETLWTNSLFGGMPTYQIHAAHPGNWLRTIEKIFQLGLPRPVNILFAAMLGFYILCQCVRANPWLSLVGAMAFGLISFNVLYIGAGHMSKVNAMVYMAPALGGVLLAFRGRWLQGAAVTALFVGLQISANHLQMTYYLLYLLAFAALGETVRLIQAGKVQSLARVLPALLVGGLIGVLPNFSNLSTTNAYGKYTTRGPSELTIQPDGSPLEESSNGLDKAYILQYSMGLGELWAMAIPNAKGGTSGVVISDEALVEKLKLDDRSMANYVIRYWGEQSFSGGSFYYGVILCMLFILGLVLWKSVTRWFFLALIVLAMLLSLKDAGGLTDFFIEQVPLFSKFRDTKMMLVVAQVLMPFIAVMGLQQLLFTGEKTEWKRPVMIAGGGVVVLMLLFMVAPSAFFNFTLDSDEAGHRRIIEPQFTQQLQQEAFQSAQQLAAQSPGTSLETVFYQEMDRLKPKYDAQIDGLVEDILYEVVPTRMAIFKSDATRSLLFVLGAFAVLLAFTFERAGKYAVVGALGILMLMDVLPIDLRYLNTDKVKGRYTYFTKAVDHYFPHEADAADLQVLAAESERLAGFEETKGALLDTYRQRLDSKRAAGLDKVEQAAAFGALGLHSNFRVLRFSSLQDVSPAELTGDGRTPYFHKSLGGYHGAKLRRFQDLIDFHLTREMRQFNASVQSLGPVAAMSAMPVVNMLNTRYLLLPGQRAGDAPLAMENVMANGVAWMISDVEWAADANEEITQLSEIDPRNTAVIDRTFESMVPQVVEADSTAIIYLDTYAPNEVSYVAESSKAQVVVFSEIWFPVGWQAYIDDQPVDHYRANYVLRALTMPAGDHTITFRFEPSTYETGNTVSAIGSVLLLLLLLGTVYQSWRAPAVSESPENE